MASEEQPLVDFEVCSRISPIAYQTNPLYCNSQTKAYQVMIRSAVFLEHYIWTTITGLADTKMEAHLEWIRFWKKKNIYMGPNVAFERKKPIVGIILT